MLSNDHSLPFRFWRECDKPLPQHAANRLDDHPESDEAFLVLNGTLRFDFRDGSATLHTGELLVVPKGVEHKPFATDECHVMVLVRGGTVNTGNAPQRHLTKDPFATV